MSLQPGNRVKITKLGHPAERQTGVILGWETLDDGSPCVYVAGENPHDGKVWPVFVLRAEHIESIEGRRSVEEIIEACERRGCPLRGIYRWAGPYKPC